MIWRQPESDIPREATGNGRLLNFAAEGAR